ncbi:MAG TPA: glucosyl-3-phosphoglycerate synthase [Chloroflexota bacterium]|nr:glucosyl-3-phosphoglycerate synthase [Chloroflexota bacterium]
MTESAFHLLLPASDLRSSPPLLRLADAILRFHDGEGTVLGIVEVPPDRSLSEGALVARRQRGLLRKLAQLQQVPQLHAEVRTARSAEVGIREACEEMGRGILLMNWNPSRTWRSSPLRQLVASPPADIAAVKPGRSERMASILVPVRGGPHALLALRTAEAIATREDSSLTLLHIMRTAADEADRWRDRQFFEAIRAHVTHPKVRLLEIEGEDVEAAILAEGARHDVVVMGAAARDEHSPYLFGRLPELVARRLDNTAVIVKTREPVTANTFGLPARTLVPPSHREISELVDRWFAENTFHSHEFRNVAHLVDLKERQNKKISVVLPTLNEEATVGKILATIQRHLMERVPLVDELIIIDSRSQDRTVEIVESLGLPVYEHPDVLSEYGSYVGKGEALWKSLQISNGDIVVWVDSDVTGFHAKYIYGLVGPLLTQPDVGFVKGFYRRPLRLGERLLTTGGGRVTELTARPLINLFYPSLSGLVQPLAGEMAGRREILESIPFFTGYGVETGLLIDILERFGLRSIAQVDLETRVHRNQSLLSLSKMAFAIVQVVVKRLEERGEIDLTADLSTSMNLIHYSPTELFLEVNEIEEHERPPIVTLPEYAARREREEAAPEPVGEGAGR